MDVVVSLVSHRLEPHMLPTLVDRDKVGNWQPTFGQFLLNDLPPTYCLVLCDWSDSSPMESNVLQCGHCWVRLYAGDQFFRLWFLEQFFEEGANTVALLDETVRQLYTSPLHYSFDDLSLVNMSSKRSSRNTIP